MVNEIFISLYLYAFRVIFNFFKLCPLKSKVTFVVSFGDNSLYVYNEMARRKAPYGVVFLYKKSCPYDLKKMDKVKAFGFETSNMIDMLKSIYHLATSKYVVIDNYFGFLSAAHFKKDVECIQLWHAAGAIKTFGQKDLSVLQRTKRARKRFSKVYEKFNKVVVGSEEMARIFTKAFNLTSENILRTGVPRTDFFHNKRLQADIVAELKRENTALNGKKVVLYAPTFRDGQLDQYEMKLDLDLMQKELGKEYILLLRFHPAIKNKANYAKQYPEFVYDYSSYPNVNKLLVVTDYLITDYSSIPFEYALLGKPMVFFPVDLELYKSGRGLWDDYESLVPGPVVHSTAELAETIRGNNFDLKQVKAFAQRWNQYSKGTSSKNIVDYIGL